MSERLKIPSMRVVGVRQTLRAIRAGKLESAFVASDAAPKIREELISAANEAALPVTLDRTMDDIGKMCRVDVPSAAAGILKIGDVPAATPTNTNP